MELLFLSDVGVVGPATERLVLIVDLECLVCRVFTHVNRRNSHEEGVISMLKSHVVRWNSEHSARIPHQLPVRHALRLRLVLDALQNAVHPVTESGLIKYQKVNQSELETEGNTDKTSAEERKK